jgi:hypothetical protein
MYLPVTGCGTISIAWWKKLQARIVAIPTSALDFWFKITLFLFLCWSVMLLYKIHFPYQKFGIFNRWAVENIQGFQVPDGLYVFQ